MKSFFYQHFITSGEVQKLLTISLYSAQRKLREIRKELNKPARSKITLYEFAEVEGFSLDLLLLFKAHQKEQEEKNNQENTDEQQA